METKTSMETIQSENSSPCFACKGLSYPHTCMDTKKIIHKTPTQTIYSDGTSDRYERGTETKYWVVNFRNEFVPFPEAKNISMDYRKVEEFFAVTLETEKAKLIEEIENMKGKYFIESQGVESEGVYLNKIDLLNKLNNL